MTTVVWSPQAIRDVEAIRSFIAQDSLTYVDLIALRLVAAVERLQVFPESGRVVPERQCSGSLTGVAAAPGRCIMSRCG